MDLFWCAGNQMTSPSLPKKDLKFGLLGLAFGLWGIFGLTGCAQSSSLEKAVPIPYVSTQETRLIRLRLASDLAIHPHDQIEFGTPSTPQEALGAQETWIDSKGEIPILPSMDLSAIPAFGEVDPLVEWLISVRKASIKYFGNYPNDLSLYRQIESHLSETTCFDDGQINYCGPSILVGGIALLGNPRTEKALHDEWLPAIEKTRTLAGGGHQSSAALENFVRTFDFGIFNSWLDSNHFVNSTHCIEAFQRLNNYDSFELPEKWPFNPCNLVLARQTSKRSMKRIRGFYPK